MKKCLLFAAVVLSTSVLAGEVKWETNYDEALAQAKKEKKLVLVDVYTDWCGWCKKLDKDVYSKKDVVEKLAKSFICVKINPEKSSKNKKVAYDFAVSGYPTSAHVDANGKRTGYTEKVKIGYPYIAFVGADGKKIDEIRGYVPADAFTQKLNEIVGKK